MEGLLDAVALARRNAPYDSVVEDVALSVPFQVNRGAHVCTGLCLGKTPLSVKVTRMAHSLYVDHNTGPFDSRSHEEHMSIRFRATRRALAHSFHSNESACRWEAQTIPIGCAARAPFFHNGLAS